MLDHGALVTNLDVGSGRMMEKRTNRQISLHDGRTLGYAEYGDPEGAPVFYFHDFPDSRLDWRLFCDDIALTELDGSIFGTAFGGRPSASFNISTYTQHRLMLRNCAPKVCRSNLRIARVGNRNSLLPPAKLTLHFLTLKSLFEKSVVKPFLVI